MTLLAGPPTEGISADPLNRSDALPITSGVDSIAHFLDHQQRRRLSENTIRVRRDVLAAIERDLGAPLIRATTADLRAALDMRPGLRPASLAKYISHLHVFYVWAIRDGRRADDPTAPLERPQLDQLLPRPIPPADLALSLQATQGQVRAWLALAAFAGLRCCEIATLDAVDVDIPGRTLIVRGKGRKERRLGMNDKIATELEQLDLATTGPIFRRRDGRPYTPTHLGQVLAAKLRSVGVNCTAHPLRHRFATDLHDLCLDMRVVQMALGHSSIATTQIYVEPNRDRLARAMAAL